MKRKVTVAIIGIFFLSIPSVLAQSLPTTVIVTIIPNAPSDLTAVPTASNQVDLTWTDNAEGMDSFIIQRKMGRAGIYEEIATTNPGIATYIDNSVSPSATYFYRVQAFEGSSFSGYSDEASVTTPSSNNGNGGGGGSGGGGGGGSGGGGGGPAPYIPLSAPAPTNVSISGDAYPSSEVFILEDGQLVLQTIAGPDAKFTTNIGNLTGGNYVFSVYAVDSAGRKSTVFTFPVTVTTGVTTMISGVFLSPTIDTDKSEVKQGDTIEIFGESAPSTTISIQIHSAQTLFLKTSSTASGAYLYDLDTSALDLGQHNAASKAINGSSISQDSFSQAFTVGSEDVSNAQPSGACPHNFARGDLNHDCHVNLIDFSILAYWYERAGFPLAYDLNGDGVIDLADFSIMAYYWTG